MIRDHLFLLLAAVFAVLYFFAAYALGLDLFEALVSGLGRLERYNVDELVIPSMVLGAALMADGLRRRKIQRIELEKAKIYKAMILSVHHVMNNFLHQMQIFKMAAETTPRFDPKILALYDQVIDHASTQIQALSSVEAINETAILKSVLPADSAKPRT